MLRMSDFMKQNATRIGGHVRYIWLEERQRKIDIKEKTQKNAVTQIETERKKDT